MLTQSIFLLGMLLVIVFASCLFTNALEHVGERLGISAGVTGSIFAAVATALPETMVPIVAIIAGTKDSYFNEQISVGAILGAPLMLSTLSTFLMAISVLKRRGLGGYIKPERKGFIRDLNFFIAAFLLAALAMFLPQQPLLWRSAASGLLVLLYLFYLLSTCLASSRLVLAGHGVRPEDPLIFTRLGCANHAITILLQCVFALGLLILGAKGFIHGIKDISEHLHLSPLILSLLIVPIATELPEKVNSIIWVRKNKDTLGVGNITGAMVFQGTLLPALGILLTPWEPSAEVMSGIAITLIAACWLRIHSSTNGLRILVLLFNGGLYFAYLAVTLW